MAKVLTILITLLPLTKLLTKALIKSLTKVLIGLLARDIITARKTWLLKAGAEIQSIFINYLYILLLSQYYPTVINIFRQGLDIPKQRNNIPKHFQYIRITVSFI